jgi:glutathione S-transferase
MKLYDFKAAPNPRRVRIFLAEKGIGIETEQVDLREMQQFTDAFKAINPRCAVPALVLDDGTVITEALAICRYFEALQPEPSLFGVTPLEQARVLEWEQRALADGIGGVGEALRNRSKFFEGRALSGPRKIPQIEALVERGRARALYFWEDLDAQLADEEFAAGERYSMADIDTLVSVDFAGWIKLEVPEGLRHVKRWHAAVSARPSAQA